MNSARQLIVASSLLLFSCGPSDGGIDLSETNNGLAADAGAEAGPSDRPDADVEATPSTAVADCFAGVFTHGLPAKIAHYDEFNPIVGSHCSGTNHQEIEGVERVVFLGDSLTAGTPPTQSHQFYRSRLATDLAEEFGLTPPSGLWNQINPFDGDSLVRDNGAFSSCAQWGKRTEHLMPDQLPSCFPNHRLDERTLVVMTMGGNDINRLADRASNGMSNQGLWVMTEEFVRRQEEALEWLLAPGRFPQGIFIVFGNVHEFTDGTMDIQSCSTSSLVGHTEPLPDSDALAEMVAWANAEYARMAVETGTDMVFVAEEICGRGVNHTDQDAPCYRGPDADKWLDLSCIHPNPLGHEELANMFLSVITE